MWHFRGAACSQLGPWSPPLEPPLKADTLKGNIRPPDEGIGVHSQPVSNHPLDHVNALNVKWRKGGEGGVQHRIR